MPTPAAASTTISSSCPECGIIQRSGKASCCGHGGSWFQNCGGAGNKKVDHTWQEGIRVCKAQQSQEVVGQQLDVVQPRSNASFGDVSKSINSKAHTTAHYMSVSGVSTSVPYAVSHASACESMTTCKTGQLLYALAHVTMILMFDRWF